MNDRDMLLSLRDDLERLATKILKRAARHGCRECGGIEYMDVEAIEGYATKLFDVAYDIAFVAGEFDDEEDE